MPRFASCKVFSLLFVLKRAPEMDWDMLTKMGTQQTRSCKSHLFPTKRTGHVPLRMPWLLWSRYPGTHSVTKICSWLLWKLIPQNNGKSSSNETHRYWPMPKWQLLATLKRFSDFLHAPARSSLHLQVPNPCLADHHLFSGTKGTQNVSGISPREEKQRTVQLSTWPKILSIDLFIVSAVKICCIWGSGLPPPASQYFRDGGRTLNQKLFVGKSRYSKTWSLIIIFPTK